MSPPRAVSGPRGGAPSTPRRGRAYLWLGLLVAVVVILNTAWLRLDTRPQPFNDPYPERTFLFVNRLPDASLGELPKLAVGVSVWGRPPLYQLATVPFVMLARSPDSMLVVNGLALIVLAVCTFTMAKMALSPGAGLLAALIILTYPPMLNLTKIARPHAVAPAAVAMSIALLLLVVRSRSILLAWFFGASLSVAFLVHPNTLYVLPFPTTLVGLYLVFFQRHPRCAAPVGRAFDGVRRRILDPFVLKGLIPAMVIALGLTAVWYVPMLRTVLRIVEESAEIWSEVRYGFESVPASFWWYARTAPGAISTFFSLLFVVSSAAALLLRSRLDRTTTAIVAVFGVGIYAGMNVRQGTYAWMNFAIALPVAAVLTAVGIVALAQAIRSPARTRNPFPAPAAPAEPRGQGRLSEALALGVVALCVGMAGLNYLIVDWGIPSRPALWRALGSPLGATCESRMYVAFCPNPPVGGDWKFNAILQAIMADSECRARECTLIMAVNWQDSFNASHLKYHRALNFPAAQLNVRRIGVYRPSTAWLTGEYLVYLRPLHGDAYQNSVARFLEAPPAAHAALFREVALFTLPNGYTARLLKRTRPIGGEEAEALIGLLDLPPSVRQELRVQARSQLR